MSKLSIGLFALAMTCFVGEHVVAQSAGKAKSDSPDGVTSTRKDFEDLCKALGGRWVGDVTWVTDWTGLGKRGEKVTAYWEGTMAEDGHVMTTKFYGGNGSETSIIYYDPGAKLIRSNLVSSGGDISRTVFYKKNGTWNFRSDGSLANGKRTSMRAAATITDDGNTWNWKGSGRVGDKAMDPLNDFWRRASK